MSRSRMQLVAVLVAPLLVGAAAHAQGAASPVVARTAVGHPMHYLISLPAGWTPDRRWPALVVIPDADRHFDEATRTFAAARGNLPFIIVTPLVLSGGGTAQQHMGDFDYDGAAWTRASRDGNCTFDEDGLTAVIADVRTRYHAEDKFFITGWEAGGHVVLSQVLDHPERWRAAAVATPNFIGRCLAGGAPTHDATTAALPVRVLHGSLDHAAWSVGQPLYSQWLRLDSLAQARGFTNVKEVVAPGRDHGPLAQEVFALLGAAIAK